MNKLLIEYILDIMVHVFDWFRGDIVQLIVEFHKGLSKFDARLTHFRKFEVKLGHFSCSKVSKGDAPTIHSVFVNLVILVF